MSDRKVLAIVLLISLTLALPKKAQGCSRHQMQKDLATTMPTMKSESFVQDNTINFDEIMAQCNESFRVTTAYLDEFNTTGSFPDEIDTTPMCYMRCYLEKAGILRDGVVVDVEKAKMNLWQLSGDSFQVCQDEPKYEKNPCKKAYFIARCLMTRAIVDGRVVR